MLDGMRARPHNPLIDGMEPTTPAREGREQDIMTTKTTTADGRTVTLRTYTVGQHFGTACRIVSRNGRTIATTDTRPYGFTDAALRDGVDLAARIGSTESVTR